MSEVATSHRLTTLLRTYRTEETSYLDGYQIFRESRTREVPACKAPLYGSRLIGSKDHLLVLDVDLPVEVRTSKTPGHHHLIVGKSLTWRQYKRALKALAKVDVVDPAWAKATIRSRNGFIAKEIDR